MEQINCDLRKLCAELEGESLPGSMASTRSTQRLLKRREELVGPVSAAGMRLGAQLAVKAPT